MSRIRLFHSGDEADVASVCLRTADLGVDATGMLADDDVWAALYVLPYVAKYPELALVVESDDGRVIGYAVGAADTDRFERWFRDRWWPRYASRWPRPAAVAGKQDSLLEYAYGRGSAPNAFQAAGYPAHMHIDLLPEAQGHGWGRRLIESLLERMREQGIAGVHLISGAANTNAVAFYEHLGLTPLDGADDGARPFGVRL